MTFLSFPCFLYSTRKHEEKVFEEKEELKSQISVVMEEKTKLSQVRFLNRIF